MDYPQILCKAFLKLKVTIIIHVMRANTFLKNVKTVRYGLENISYMASKIWDLLPKEMKQVTTPNEFKAKIKIWKLENCSCRLCRTYLPQTGSLHNAF